MWRALTSGMRRKDAVLLGALGAGVLSLSASLAGRFVLDIDDANLALGIERFDVRMHQPHPPGYLGYVMLLRLVHALSGLSLLDVPRWTARGFALLTIYFAWRAAKAFGADEVRARWAALLCATNPIILYYAVDGQTHAAEAAMSAALVWALANPNPLVVGALVAAGGSFRPTYLLLSAVAVAWAFRGRRLVWVAALAGAGTLAWLVPTVILTGGWASYRAANDALVGGLVKQFSLLSSTGDARYIALNLRDALAWSVIALAPLMLLQRSVDRRAAILCGAIVIPSLLFYTLVICAEAGYLAGLVAPAAVLGALASRRRWLPPLLAAAQLGFFLFGPQQLGRTFMLPDVSEIVDRDVRTTLLFDALHREAPPEARVLVVSDFPDLTVMRQLPLVRPATEILFVHDKAWFPAGGESWISYATAHGWWAAPGIVLRNDGDDARIRSHTSYDLIALDPRASEPLRDALRTQTRCPVASRSQAEARVAQRWPRSCFGESLRFFDRVFELTR